METVDNIVNKDFKYVMMDTGNIFLGARYSYSELLEEDMVPFKLKVVISHYLLKETDPETTLESQLYYLEAGNLLYDSLKQLRVKVKVNALTEKKRLFREPVVQYQEKVMGLEELVGTNLARKKAQGLIIREMIVSRLGLMAFSI